MTVHEGGCLCGAVRYEISAEPEGVAVCHCRECRLASGASSLAWMTVPLAALKFVEGQPKSVKSSSPVVRMFCGDCGTAFTYAHEDWPDFIDVTVATLDRPDTFPPTKEIWLDERVGWQSLNDTLPHFSRGSMGTDPL
jgi:hypothetical protein